MSGYLLDKNVALIAQSQSRTLSREILEAIASGPNFLSVISYWEVTIKSMKGSLEVGNQFDWWSNSLSNFSAIPLNLLPEHIAEIHRLPAHHQDPFDRALIAQAIAEDLTILTTGRQVSGYASNQLKIIF